MNLDDYFNDISSAISGGTFDPQGMNFTDFGKTAGMVSNRFSDKNYGGAWSAISGAGIGGSTKVTSPNVSATDAIGNKLREIIPNPFLSDQSQNDKTVDVGLQSGLQGYLSGIGSSIEAWIPRIILVVLGLIFVAVGLAMFGAPVPGVQGIAQKIPGK